MPATYLCCAWRGEHDDTGPAVLLAARSAVADFLARHAGDCALARFERWNGAEPFFWREGDAGVRIDRHVRPASGVAQEP